MAIVWPASLPQAQNIGTEIWEDPAVLRSKMDVGPDKIRQRATITKKFFKTPFELNGTEYAAFLAFLVTIAQGATPFQWTDPADDTVKTCRLIKTPKWKMKSGASSPSERRYTGNMEVEIVA